MQSLGIPLSKIRDALRSSNIDVGGRTIELAETEFVVRGRGYIKSLADLEQIVVKNDRGVPVLLRDVARVELAPDERRGITELNGEGEVVTGIVLQRFGENALTVIKNVKDRLAEMAPSLPQGVTLDAVYDRSDLIYRAIDTLKRTLIEESIIVAAVCVIFLLHVRSALVAIITLPLGVLIAYLCMHLLGLSSNIMSLGGIAIAIGAMVDAAIVMIENAHKHLERAKPGTPRSEVLIEAAIEVGPALFFSLLIITVSFLPIFALEAQEGRMFKPLAYTKTFAMAAAALLSVTLVPALMILFVRGRIMPEHKNPVNRALIWLYRPVIRAALKYKAATILIALGVLLVSLWPASRLGTEFMPTLNEGTLFYMPTTLPGLSVTKAAELLQTQNKIIKTFPEVASVWGKAGRASTATDPAPTEMFETVINLKPESEWRPGMTTEKLIAELDKALQFPGVSNAWTMPIKARTDMLATGIRTPVGVKVYGTDLGRDGEPRPPDRDGGAHGAGHHQRLRRTHHRRLLSQHRSQPRAARALRPDDHRRAGRDRHRARCRGGDHHGRGPRALHGEHPVPARTAQRPAGDRDAGADPVAQWRHSAARRSGQGRACQGAGHHPHRERAARRLYLYRPARPRHRRLRGRRAEGGGGRR